MRRLRKLTALSRSELAELVSAQWALIHAQWLRWQRPTGAFVSPVASLAAAAGTGDAGHSDSEASARAERIALAVGRAAENGIFHPACLVRSIALTRMLEARGIHGSQLRVGVRWEGERFAAHAWVEYGGRVLGDREEHVSGYTPLSDVEVLR
ncbi:MAG TPA: lasso peptide biosynthesis B2 protein [Longimicrobiaceae bacterium]|nr:lasso peptide biosynthesis B2 protein [Longimicrobiaceae bacterium]